MVTTTTPVTQSNENVKIVNVQKILPVDDNGLSVYKIKKRRKIVTKKESVTTTEKSENSENFSWNGMFCMY